MGKREDLNSLKQAIPSIDWDIIAEHEGYSITPGMAYYPGIEGSGVTIGMGVDLSRQSLGLLRKYGLKDQNLIAKLAPYSATKSYNDDGTWNQVIGPVSKKAGEMPFLQITNREADELNKAVGLDMFVKTAKRYSKETNKDFQLLPKKVQTTILSMTWNMGADFSAPKAWDAIKREDWEGLGLELSQGKWSDNKDRRVNEGNYLLDSIYDKQYKE